VQVLHPAEPAARQAACEESQRRGTIEANLDQLKVRAGWPPALRPAPLDISLLPLLGC
jgi:hypothetical protein